MHLLDRWSIDTHWAIIGLNEVLIERRTACNRPGSSQSPVAEFIITDKNNSCRNVRSARSCVLLMAFSYRVPLHLSSQFMNNMSTIINGMISYERSRLTAAVTDNNLHTKIKHKNARNTENFWKTPGTPINIKLNFNKTSLANKVLLNCTRVSDEVLDAWRGLRDIWIELQFSGQFPTKLAKELSLENETVLSNKCW